MTRENSLKLKQELKVLAIQIRQQKSTVKENNRAYSKEEALVGPLSWYPYPEKQKELAKLYGPLCSSQHGLTKIKQEFRAKHVVYCLARGRLIEQIEPNADREHFHWYEVHKSLVPKYAKEYGLYEDERINKAS